MTDVRYFVSRRDLARAKQLLEAAHVDYRTEPWQPGVTSILVDVDADVSHVFGPKPPTTEPED
jgi:hypothetical protein